MNLYLLRHGLAVEPGAPEYLKDAERPLTPEGVRKLRKAARAMQVLDLQFDLILSSPYTRARQTAELVASALGARKRPEYSATLVPGGSFKQLIRLLQQFDSTADNILLVGHEPFLSELISLLVSGDTRSGVVMKKGGLCKLEIQALAPRRCAVLEWLLTPRQMSLMT